MALRYSTKTHGLVPSSDEVSANSLERIANSLEEIAECLKANR